jgi:hypothetical protein
MILKFFRRKNLAKTLAFFARTAASFCKNLIMVLFFEKNANFVLPKIGKKIAENCYHNLPRIDLIKVLIS